MNIPEGFFNAGEKADEKGGVASWVCQDDQSITKLWIPNVITSIGNCAFKGCSNLVTIIFEDGGEKLELGLMAFEDCSKLREVQIPSRLASIGKACFRGCSLLERIDFSGGKYPLDDPGHVFDGCPQKEILLATFKTECVRRSALMPRRDLTSVRKRNVRVNEVLESMRAVMPKDGLSEGKIKQGLESVYQLVCTDPDFGFEKHYTNYQKSCEYFAGIEDWNIADSNKIKNLLHGQFAHRVAGIDKGRIPDDQLELTKEKLDKLREVCNFISHIQGAEDEQLKVLEYKAQFCRLFTDMDHHAAYYRIIAAIRPDLVVNIPVAAKLSAVYAWLVGVDLPRGDIADWFKMSLGVRKKLQEFLPDKTIYQVGSFSWHIADAFRADKELNDTQIKCKYKVLERLRDVGLLAKNS